MCLTRRSTLSVVFLLAAGLSLVACPPPTVVIDGTGCLAIDPDVREALRDFRVRATREAIVLELRGVEGVDGPPHRTTH